MKPWLSYFLPSATCGACTSNQSGSDSLNMLEPANEILDPL